MNTEKRRDITVGVLMDILNARARQEAKWGHQHHPPGTSRKGCFFLLAQKAKELVDVSAELHQATWAGILIEEVLEVMSLPARPDPKKLQTELLQVAAVAAAWVEDIRETEAMKLGGSCDAPAEPEPEPEPEDEEDQP